MTYDFVFLVFSQTLTLLFPFSYFFLNLLIALASTDNGFFTISIVHRLSIGWLSIFYKKRRILTFDGKIE